MNLRPPSATQDTGVIEILDPNLKQGFAQIPRPVLKAKRLSRNAKCLYALLLDYAWQQGSCFPGQQKLAEDLDVTDRTVRTDLTELRDYGLIDWKRRGLTLSNIYYILPLADNPRLDLVRESLERKDPSAQERKALTAKERKARSEEQYSEKKYSITTDDDMAAALEKFGISRNQAQAITLKYPSELILEKLDIVQYLQSTNSPLVTRNPQGFLIRAIQENYLPVKPKGYKSQADIKHEEEERRELDEQLSQAQEDRTRAIQAFKENRPPRAIPSTKLTTKTAWEKTLEILQRDMSRANFQTWIKETAMIDYQDQHVLIATPTDYAADWLQQRLAASVVNALSKVLGHQVSVEFEAVPEMTGSGHE